MPGGSVSNAKENVNRSLISVKSLNHALIINLHLVECHSSIRLHLNFRIISVGQTNVLYER